MSIPGRDPDIFRRFQYTSLTDNSNKFWTIKAWDLGSHWEQTTEYARTGMSPQFNTKRTTRGKIQTLIGSKLRKGYKELVLHQVSNGNGHTSKQLTGVSEVDWLVSKLNTAASKYISSYLNTTIDQLSHEQIQEGRSLLQQIAIEGHRAGFGPESAGTGRGRAIELAEAYYMAIPTKLPHRINPLEVMRSLYGDMHEQEERLDQLERAIVVSKPEPVTDGTTSALELLGAVVEPVDLSSPEGQRILHTLKSSRRVSRLYRITSPAEREAFTENTQSIGNAGLYLHGTKSGNIRHILPSGLIIPKHAANGSLYGRGIYFTDDPRKSLGYTGGNLTVLLVAEVALGNVFRQQGTNRRLTSAPHGYQSVHGRHNYNEFIIYRAFQQTLRFLAVLD